MICSMETRQMKVSVLKFGSKVSSQQPSSELLPPGNTLAAHSWIEAQASCTAKCLHGVHGRLRNQGSFSTCTRLSPGAKQTWSVAFSGCLKGLAHSCPITRCHLNRFIASRPTSLVGKGYGVFLKVGHPRMAQQFPKQIHSNSSMDPADCIVAAVSAPLLPVAARAAAG